MLIFLISQKLNNRFKTTITKHFWNDQNSVNYDPESKFPLHMINMIMNEAFVKTVGI